MKLNKAKAARQAGISRTTLDQHLRKGIISGVKDERGRTCIDISELERVYGSAVNTDTSSDVQPVHQETSTDVQIRLARAEALNEQLEAERDDLRRRLDQESEERRRLTAMLTDQREHKNIWRRLFGR